MIARALDHLPGRGPKGADRSNYQARPMTSGRRFTELDGLRGVAVLLVIAFHYTHQFRERWSQPFSSSFDSDIGYMGVHLFFVISGCVIHMTVLRCNGARDFAWKRFLRLYPAFWICSTMTFLALRLYPLSGSPTPSTVQWLTGLSMLSPIFHVPWVDGAYWSLFVELTFYTLIAAVLLTSLRRYASWAALIWFVLIIIHYRFPLPGRANFFLCLDHGGLFLAGLLFYRLWTMNGDRTAIHAALLVVLLVDLRAFAERPSEAVFLLLVFGVFWALTFTGFAVLRNKPLLFFGWISYPLYLIHQEVGNVIITWTRAHGLSTPFDLLSAFISSVLVATLVTRYAEPWIKQALRTAWSSLSRIHERGEPHAGS